MVSIKTARKIALSFPETDEHPHFDRIAFRVKKKIFATLLEKDKTMNLMLTPEDQSVFCRIDKHIVYPVPNKWGLKGATTVELKNISMTLFKDILTVAYCSKAPANLSQQYNP
ncbi:MAG TPA: MmcQ/YjbR family DNA-binding protein [Chitinophagaceae bacterium]|nr:MmcQ/YjbR family DNA-binding protein [Chitinophagaceae bacterium]HPG12688.1 MmcQ/YjbR family DNA-binding protein [Chitinophagaceae bacterium]